ncbi:hypothetical protein GGQ54_001428 [Naumannella cuiyingiana]|uniref:Uncharacterized protein n=2 Tax=Naumannella cuiyingiana TaxID=1347891 RepID=A0A7Z0D8G7_9ACTN|nr:hypothetical protein [Naumannella cuiyingiana]
MLVVVKGCPDFGSVPGLMGDAPSALFDLVRRRQSSGHVLVLAPEYAEIETARQKHVLASAMPEVACAVLALPHHAFGLMAFAVTIDSGRGRLWHDPGQAVAIVQDLSDRSRSVVWHPRLGGLADPRPNALQTIGGLVGQGWFATVGEPGLSRQPPQPEGGLHWSVAGAPPAKLRQALGGLSVTEVDFPDEQGAPYCTRGSVQLGGLAAVRPAAEGAGCRVCGAMIVDEHCRFCLQRPTESRSRQGFPFDSGSTELMEVAR